MLGRVVNNIKQQNKKGFLLICTIINSQRAFRQIGLLSENDANETSSYLQKSVHYSIPVGFMKVGF